VFIRERAGAPTSLDELGLSSEAVNAVETALRRQSGAVLVCGPAGSGTTTTLYAMLGALATPERVVATVEHPVERLVEGIDQVEVAPSAGVTFAGALRDLCLTDTDAVLVGNLPDLESATGALGAAYEGRLVMAGFRARSASAAVLRLADMGVEPTTLASSLGCVVSQRLVRTVCADCREPYYASDEELAALDQPDTGSPRLLVRGTGCDHCAGTGFRGRKAIFEVMPVTDELRGLIADGASAKKLQKAAVAAGMRTLRDEGVRLCLDGLTTVDEVVRVLGDDA
jgi:type II secretory ATPase GspE/PulE/Tfp pilus assembly ATPase PilB-like protein